MHRSMMQIYVKDSGRAVALYQQAFEAVLVCAYPTPEGNYYHAELDVYGQILAVSEADEGYAFADVQDPRAAPFRPGTPCDPGNTMQFCLHMGEGKGGTVRRIYDILREGALVLAPLGPCGYSPGMFDLVDTFGVRWCIFE